MPVLSPSSIPTIWEEIQDLTGPSNATFYRWRAKYGGMDALMISQMKALEEENRRLKRMYADLSMQTDILKEALGKK
ncbi:transposase (plasmid) [Acetobacter oryzifermentans]|uniref:Transposase n=1 Tax=Acetobacter oryzifermentans TaxID=1633874 RepID=A0ABM6ANG6_9PROT|nr:transposase [Acetobacter oryzifermentans]